MMRIGEFSRLSQTPVSTLRYYDEVGLLKPVAVDRFSGYRFYSFEQLPRLHRILALKNLGFALEEIARFLEGNVPSKTLGEMVQRKRSELRKQTDEQRERLERLEAWLKQIEREKEMTTIPIRPARIESDLNDLTRLIRPLDGEHVTEEVMRKRLEYNPPGRIQQRLVSEDESGRVSGYAGYVHEAGNPEGQYTAWVVVDPEQRGQGIGLALWNVLEAELGALKATRLDTDLPDNDPPSLVFAEHRGFRIDQHICSYALDLAAFDETPYLADIAALEAQGIRFCSLADFPVNEESNHKLYDLNTNDMLENAHNSTPWTYAVFEEFVLKAGWFRREGQLLAVDGDQWIGMAAVSLAPAARNAYNEYTGVLRPYRRRKIATSLKVLAARYARQSGAEKLLTESNLRNRAILTINRKLGYAPQTGKYILMRDL
jgi:DNA-binding transcriptional MerR regulator